VLLSCAAVFAGGGGENMLLVVNPNDPTSLQIANVYAALRDIPANNILYLAPPSYYHNDGQPINQSDVTGGTASYLSQISSAISTRGLSNQINYIGTLGQAVSYNIDVPPAPDNGLPLTTANSLAYALSLLTPLTNGSGLTLQGALSKYNTSTQTFYAPTSGLYQNPSNIAINGAADAAIQHSSTYSITFYPTDSGTNITTQYYMAGAIGYTGTNGNTAAQVIASLQSAAAADGTHPTGTAYFEYNSNVRATTRAPEWTATISQLNARGILALSETNTPGATPLNRNNVLLATTGSETLTLPNGSTYLPGSWADNLTSYGCEFTRTDQTHATAFIAAGAAGTTGSVIEPYAIPERFTNSSIDTFIVDGATLGEAFAKSVATPDIQLPLGDMLAQPYADVPKVAVTTGPGNYGMARGSVTIGGSAALVSPRIATGINKLELLVDGIVSPTLTLAGSSGSFSLNTTGLSDGVHEVRLVAVNNAQAASEGYLAQAIVVNNHGRAVNFGGGSTTLASSAGTIRLAATAGDGTISQVELTCLGRVVAQGSGAAGALSLAPGTLAPGDNVIVPVAVFSDGSQVAGGAFTVHVESGAINAWNNAAGTWLWSNTANWSGQTLPQNGDGVARFSGASRGTVTLDASASVEEIDFDNTSGGKYTLAASPGQTLTLSSSNGPMSQALINVLGGTHTISAPLAFSAPGSLVNITSATDLLTISGAISGSGALTKTGAGGLLLLGANSYTGATSVNSGYLQIGSGGTLGSLGSGPVVDNAAILFNRSDTYLVGNSISGAGSLTQRGPGTLVLTGSSTFTGTTAVIGAALTISGNGGIAQGSGLTVTRGTAQLDDSARPNNFSSSRLGAQTTSLQGGALSINFGSTTGGTETLGPVAAAADDNLLAWTLSGGSGTISGGALSRSAGATLNFSGPLGSSNRLILSGMSAGSNLINVGTFVNGADYAVYDANGYVRAMTTGINPWDYASSMSSGRNVKLTSSTTASGTPLTLNLSGSSAGVSLSSGQSLSLTLGGLLKGGGGTATISGGTVLNTAGQSVEFVIRTDTAADQLAINMPVSGGTGLTKSGQGTLVLGSSNSYGGSTTINAGTLRTTAAGAIPAASPLVIASSAALDLNGKAQTVAGITLNDGAVLNSDGPAILTLGGIGGGVTYSGVGSGSSISGGTLNLAIAGSVSAAHFFSVARGQANVDLSVSDNIADGSSHSQSLIKTGDGLLRLSGTNTYSGGTQVMAGTLVVANPWSIPGGDLNVGSNLGLFADSVVPATMISSAYSSLPADGLSGLTSSDDPANGSLLSAPLPPDSSSTELSPAAQGGLPSVPEPNTLVLLLAGGGFGLAWRATRSAHKGTVNRLHAIKTPRR
jgi:fibronectin-binding autotransporter adhesin